MRRGADQASRPSAPPPPHATCTLAFLEGARRPHGLRKGMQGSQLGGSAGPRRANHRRPRRCMECPAGAKRRQDRDSPPVPPSPPMAHPPLPPSSPPHAGPPSHPAPRRCGAPPVQQKSGASAARPWEADGACGKVWWRDPGGGTMGTDGGYGEPVVVPGGMIRVQAGGPTIACRTWRRATGARAGSRRPAGSRKRWRRMPSAHTEGGGGCRQRVQKAGDRWRWLVKVPYRR
jgi:hypothetical protein